MDAALKIPEILLLIFEVLESGSLANASLVSSSWAPLALSIKWTKTLITLTQLVQAFRRARPLTVINDSQTSPACSQLDQGDPGYSRSIPTASYTRSMPTAGHMRPMSRTDFLAFSSKIQRFSVENALWSAATFSKEEIREIEELLQGRAFMPNLREVAFERRPNDETAALLLGGGLRIETLEAGPRYSVESVAPYPVERWTQMLHRARLRRLKLYTKLPSDPVDLTQLRHLHHLDICNEFSVADDKWWLTLAKCENLRTLNLNLDIIHLPATSHPTAFFPMLESLSISTKQPTALRLILYSSMPSLSALRVVEGLESPDLGQLVTHLERESPYLDDLDLHVRADVPSLLGKAIPALLANLKLKKLALSSVVHIQSDPAHKEALPLEYWVPLLAKLDSFCLSVFFTRQTRNGTPAPCHTHIGTKETPVATVKCVNGWKRLHDKIKEYRTVLDPPFLDKCTYFGRAREQSWKLLPLDT
ncbi:hypothetical protein FRB99_006502 [Tulasnella sp. 403]|nr:hypothetical protein FRB99_006502 [Tulasnella sp. 403]